MADSTHPAPAPRPVPEDVPGDLVALAVDAHEKWHIDHRTNDDFEVYRSSHEQWVRATLAAVLPAYIERVLTAAADQLDAMPETDGAALQGPYWYRDGWKQATGMLRDWADNPAVLADREDETP